MPNAFFIARNDQKKTVIAIQVKKYKICKSSQNYFNEFSQGVMKYSELS